MILADEPRLNETRSCNSPRKAAMTKEEITAWALANGWQMMDGVPSLTKPAAPHPAIVRLILKTTVASVEIKKPAGKWEKVSSESYSKIEPDPETGMPGGLGFATISGLSLLMRDNKDRQMFARMGGMKR
jgi:hypothetical protein